MISMRYHIVSLAAVFLALALGIVLGATKISSPLLVGLQGDIDTLAVERADLSTTNETLSERVTSDEKFADAVGELAVRGTLPDAKVVLVTTADADPADRDAVLSLLDRAGASVTAQLQVTEAFTDPARADELQALAAKSLPTGASLPEVPESGAVAGGLLAALLVAKEDGTAPAAEDQTTAALAALTSAGYITSTGTLEPGRLVVLLTGGAVTGGSEADRAGTLADFAAQLKRSSAGVVVGGRIGSAETAAPTGTTAADGTSGAVAAVGVIGVIRADTTASAAVTTVDNLDDSSGRLAVVLGLVEQNGGGVGRYGLAADAQAQIPTLAVG